MNEIEDMLEAVLDETYQRHRDNRSEETFLECKLCEGWETHDPNCPIPLIEKWFESKPKRINE